MTTQDVTLLPCPFCGEQPNMIRRVDGYQIRCANMDCDAGAIVLMEYRDEAIAAWNRRTPLADDERATLTARIANVEADHSESLRYIDHLQAREAEMERTLKARIAELEAGITQIDVAWDTASRAVSELEHELEQLQAQAGTWLPIAEWWEHRSVAGIAKRTTVYNPGNNGIGIEVVYDDGMNRMREYAGENLPSNVKLCRRHDAGQEGSEA